MILLSKRLESRPLVEDQRLKKDKRRMEHKALTSYSQHMLPRAHNSQSQPSRPNVSIPRSDLKSKLEYCIPCEKSFKEKKHLDQHLRDSMKHKSTSAVSPWTALPDFEHE